MDSDWPNLQVLALYVAVVEEGGLGAGARRLGMQQPNASRMIRELEAKVKTPLLERRARGSRPTPAGMEFAARARQLLDSARQFGEWMRQSSHREDHEVRVGASMTIAERLLPAWLTALRQHDPRARVDLAVLNSAQVLHELREGRLRLGFVETPHIPRWVHARRVSMDELAVVVSPNHPWAGRFTPVTMDELTATPLVVREGGSGTREAFEALVEGLQLAPPVQVLGSNAAVRVAVMAGAGPAVLSTHVVGSQLESGELVRVPVKGRRLTRPFTAVWTGPRRLTGAAADLVSIADKRR